MRRKLIQKYPLLVHVSIHARVERATVSLTLNLDSLVVSIHARVERATAFQNYLIRIAPVSIHARVERATK